MASMYTREQLRLSVAKMCLTIGWHTTMTTPIELLTDILCNYLSQLGKLTSDYANGFGLSEASIEHLALAFKDFHVGLQDLSNFVQNVDSPEPPVAVPQYPVRRADHLNFLKPGSKEVVTRQVHVHEHLPPMFPELEEDNSSEEFKTEPLEEVPVVKNLEPIFKRRAEVIPDVFKRPRILSDEEAGRPTREITSVMMTTSGFLSPAREGRLPEARTPAVALETTYPMPPPVESDSVKKAPKPMKKSDKMKEDIYKDLFKPYKDSQSHKHLVKNIARSKMKHHSHTNPTTSSPTRNYVVTSDPKPHTGKHRTHKRSHLEHDTQVKFNKALAAARMKTEKFNTTITPIPATVVRAEQLVDKLFAEPDKHKVNILRKISVKSDRTDKTYKIKDEMKVEPRESSSDFITDETNPISSRHTMPKDITIELVKPLPIPSCIVKKSPEKPDKFEKYYFDDYSPPGTPSMPRTPEMISQSPPLTKAEKRKLKHKHKKFSRYSSPSGMDIDSADVELERPKTPDSSIIMKPEKRKHSAIPPMHFPLFAPFSGPGLIPTPLTSSLFSHLPIPPLGLPAFGQPPYIPSLHPSLPLNFLSPAHSPICVPTPAVSPPRAAATLVAAPSPVTGPSSSPSTSTKAEEYNAQPSCSTPDSNSSSMLRVVDCEEDIAAPFKADKKTKEHKREKKDKLKKKNKKDKHKSEKKKLKEEKKERSRIKKEKKEKKKNKESQEGSTSPVPKLTLKLPAKAKLNIKAIVKPEKEMEHHFSTSKATDYTLERGMSPELARFSALVTGQPKAKNHTAVTSTSREEEVIPQAGPSRRPGRPRIHPIIPRPAGGHGRRRRASSEDSEGKKVWICPGCGVQDDGSPMIGCDDCDAWYHWVCVGIQVPPDDNEDWYCKHCLEKNRDLMKREKKKKRKSRDKKSRKH